MKIPFRETSLTPRTIFGDLVFKGGEVEKDRYRYQLYRHELRQPALLDNECWALPGQAITFVMLNPSTADVYNDDPTIRRCRDFAIKWGFEHVFITNLFAWRSTDPKQLRYWHDRELDVVGPRNDDFIYRCCKNSRLVVVAWGALDKELQWREKEVLDLIKPFMPTALGLTREGHPRHPLYLRKDSKPFKHWWEGRDD